MVPLLDLPWELRSVILRHAMRPQRRREPVFDKKFIEGRVRLRNCFDEMRPDGTNIYVEKPRRRYRTVKALLATSRQLHDETIFLINEDFKTGKVEAPFILDIMYVKDVGVFPTWLSFSYKTKRISRLDVNLRIIRPDPKSVPAEWISLARFPLVHSRGQAHAGPCPSPIWNFFAALVLYSLNRLSIKPTTNRTEPDERKLKKGSNLNHTSIFMDAHLVPIEATPYVVDRLHLDFKPCEYRANGTVIDTGVEDPSRASPFYKEGYIQFGREIFQDSSGYSDSFADDEIQLAERAAGRLASRQLLDHAWEPISKTIDYPTDEFFFYQNVLANSVGEVTFTTPNGSESCIKSKDTARWVSVWESSGEWETTNISKAIAEEEARDDPARGYIAMLKIAKRRRALGWQAKSVKG